MASSKNYLQFVLEQLSELDEITYRTMMGEFIIYYRGKIVGGIYDDRLLVKPTKSAIDYTEEHYGKTKYIFVKKEDPLRPFQYSMLQHRVMQMIRKNDIRDENGELLNFGTHTFRHCYGKKLTEMHIDDWMIARLLGHKTLQSVHHYRKIGNKIMADETRAVREKIDMILMDVVKEWDGYEI